MTSVSADHIILTPTQPVGSRRPQRGSNPGPPHQESRALPTERSGSDVLHPSIPTGVCAETVLRQPRNISSDFTACDPRHGDQDPVVELSSYQGTSRPELAYLMD